MEPTVHGHGGSQFMVILNLLGISYHAVVVFGQGKNLLFKSVAGHCVYVLKVPGGSSVDLISIGAYFLMASW